MNGGKADQRVSFQACRIAYKVHGITLKLSVSTRPCPDASLYTITELINHGPMILMSASTGIRPATRHSGTYTCKCTSITMCESTCHLQWTSSIDEYYVKCTYMYLATWEGGVFFANCPPPLQAGFRPAAFECQVSTWGSPSLAASNGWLCLPRDPCPSWRLRCPVEPWPVIVRIMLCFSCSLITCDVIIIWLF